VSRVRENLKKINGKRKTFTGVFERFGTKNNNFAGYQQKTVLLKNIKSRSGKEFFAEHVWFNYTKEFAKLNLKEGDKVMFDARVREYIKGYRGHREEVQWEKPIEKDYKLSHPTKIKLIGRNNKKSQTQLKTPQTA